MATFRHNGQTYIVPDEVAPDYDAEASLAATDDASSAPGDTRSEDPHDASHSPDSATPEDAEDSAPRKRSSRKR